MSASAPSKPDGGVRALAQIVERFAAMPRERRSRRPYDRLLRAFLKARAWPGGRRALLDALPEGGTIPDGDTFALTIDRLGYRCGWRLAFAAALSESDLPTIAVVNGELVLLRAIREDGAIEATNAADEPRTISRSVMFRTLTITECVAECRSSIGSVGVGMLRPLGMALALTAPVVVLAATAPALTQRAVDSAMAGAASPAGAILFALAVCCVAARIARDRVLAIAAATAEARFASIAAERRLHADPAEQALNSPVDAPQTIARLCASGTAGAALDCASIIAGCIGVLIVGGQGAIAPTFAALALALLLSMSRPISERLVEARADDQATHLFRRRDRTASLVAIAHGISLFSAFGLFLGWSASGASIGALAGLAVGLWLAVRPLLSLIAQDQTLADAAHMLNISRALETAPGERRRLSRTPLKRPCGIALSDIDVADCEGDRGIRVSGVLRIEPGEVVAVTGGAAAGADTLLKLCAGLVAPDSGGIIVGGRDLRRIDRVAFRAEIAYVAEAAALPTATMSALVRRLAPIIDEAAALDALERAGLSLDVSDFPAGAATVLTGDDPRWTRKRRLQLALAGGLARRAGLMVCRLPDAAVDQELEQILIRQFSALRGFSTIVFATDRPSLVQCADRVLQLERGRVVAFAPPGLVTPLRPSDRARARVFGRA